MKLSFCRDLVLECLEKLVEEKPHVDKQREGLTNPQHSD